MRNSWARQALVAVTCVAALACGGSDGVSNDPTAQSSAKPAAEQPAAATVALTGCLEAAPGTRQYVLRNVRFEPRSGGDPHSSTTTSGGHGITEGAWVRVDGGDRNLDGYLGQRIVLKGTVTDDGRNTIGTAGATGAITPPGDRSQAPSSEHHASKDKGKMEMGRIARESMADGTAAKLRVQDVSPMGDRCVAQ